jgi:hypothetical protein
MKASLVTLVGAATVLAASLTGASAQVINLTGQFQCVRLCSGAPPALAYLTQVLPPPHSRPGCDSCD